MDSLALNLLPFFDWLLRTTCQASLLIGLILALQKVLGRRLGVRGRYCLWLVVLIRLALPWAPQSWVSVHNLLPLWQGQGYRASIALAANRALAGTGGAPTAKSPGRTGPGTGGAAEPASGRDGRSPAGRRLEIPTMVLLSMIWLGGVCALAGCIAAGGRRLRGVVRRGRPVTDRWVLDLLEECQRRIGTRADVGVLAVDGIASPSLFGIVRPRLLLPREILAETGRDELRHIFLHELAHHKRHDILIGYVAGVLHILHWFNPLIALGLRRMRADVELACDGLALSVLEPGEVPAYGRTVVSQIERLLASPWRSALPALCGDRARVKQRIAMISAFEKGMYRRSPLTMVLVACLACVGLTDGLAGMPGVEPPSNPWDAYARRNFRTTHQDRHANILRCCLRNMETDQYLVVDGEKVACADEPGRAGLWEFRFDEVSNTPADRMYFYSVAAKRYLTSDAQGNLAVSAREPEDAACWGAWPHPGGVFVISHFFKDGYLRLNEQGQVHAENFGRDSRGYWDVHSVWRVKTSDDPKSNPDWQREHIPGPD